MRSGDTHPRLRSRIPVFVKLGNSSNDPQWSMIRASPKDCLWARSELWVWHQRICAAGCMCSMQMPKVCLGIRNTPHTRKDFKHSSNRQWSMRLVFKRSLTWFYSILHISNLNAPFHQYFDSEIHNQFNYPRRYLFQRWRTDCVRWLLAD